MCGASFLIKNKPEYISWQITGNTACSALKKGSPGFPNLDEMESSLLPQINVRSPSSKNFNRSKTYFPDISWHKKLLCVTSQATLLLHTLCLVSSSCFSMKSCKWATQWRDQLLAVSYSAISSVASATFRCGNFFQLQYWQCTPTEVARLKYLPAL